MIKDETLAIIDLGTNKFHLIIVELISAHEFRVKEKYKEPVLLGEDDMGSLSPAAFERGLNAMRRFKQLIETRGAHAVLAFATSAIRTAANGAEFVRKVFEETGIAVQIINGNEEAAYIYQGVRFGLNLPLDEDVLMVDIGGGSVEFIVGNRLHAKLLRSVNVGASRLLQHVRPSDPITADELKKIEEFLNHKLGPLLDELREFPIRTLVGSSGTFDTLGSLAADEAGERQIQIGFNGYAFDSRRFKRVYKRIVSANRAQRLAMPGMEPYRVDLIVMGVALVDFLVERLSISRLVVSAYSLKEGMLAAYIDKQLSRPHSRDEMGQREKAVRALGEKFAYAKEHVDLVSKFSLKLFDLTQSIHGYGPEERELLHYAALLHDIGHYINRSGHHKHSQYIIQNCALPGFSTDELLMIANIARYHRKSLPSPEHLHYNLLFKEHKERVKKLSGILRLAVNLDRAYRGVVKDIDLSVQARQFTLTVYSGEDAGLEIEATRAASELFEIAFDAKLFVKPA
jgi:exopolyphosphatase/guanosine-5'-triphosphate,3'-diphosphate pyrophosphatase